MGHPRPARPTAPRRACTRRGAAQAGRRLATRGAPPDAGQHLGQPGQAGHAHPLRPGRRHLDPGDKLITVTAADPDVPTAAVIRSTSHEFTAWSTSRLPWRDHATVTG